MKTYLQFLEATSASLRITKPETKVDPEKIKSGVTGALKKLETNPGEGAFTNAAERKRSLELEVKASISGGGSQRQSQPQAKNRPAPSSTSTPDRGRTTPPTAGRVR